MSRGIIRKVVIMALWKPFRMNVCTEHTPWESGSSPTHASRRQSLPGLCSGGGWGCWRMSSRGLEEPARERTLVATVSREPSEYFFLDDNQSVCSQALPRDLLQLKNDMFHPTEQCECMQRIFRNFHTHYFQSWFRQTEKSAPWVLQHALKGINTTQKESVLKSISLASNQLGNLAV